MKVNTNYMLKLCNILREIIIIRIKTKNPIAGRFISGIIIAESPEVVGNFQQFIISV